MEYKILKNRSYEEFYLVGHNTVPFIESQLMFHKNMSHPRLHFQWTIRLHIPATKIFTTVITSDPTFIVISDDTERIVLFHSAHTLGSIKSCSVGLGGGGVEFS
jgi:hypothetical protein